MDVMHTLGYPSTYTHLETIYRSQALMMIQEYPGQRPDVHYIAQGRCLGLYYSSVPEMLAEILPPKQD